MIRQFFRGRALPALALLLVPTGVYAQDRDNTRYSGDLPGHFSFELGAGTDNRSKDASKSGNDGYAFGSATWESADGLFYVGPGFQTIQAGGSNVEAEFVVGYQPEAFGYRFDFNVAYKNRLDAEAGYDQDAWEITGNASRSIGPASARLQVQYSPDAAGSPASAPVAACSSGVL